MLFGNKIKGLEAQIHESKQEAATLSSNGAVLREHIGNLRSELLSVVYTGLNKQLSANVDQARMGLNKLLPYNIPGWKAESWKSWNPHETDLTSPFYFCGLSEADTAAELCYSAPATTAFFNHYNSYFIESCRDDSNLVYAHFQSLALRIYARLLNNVTFTFIDPSGFGKAFPIAQKLNQRASAGDLFRLLEDIARDITNINQTYGLSDDKPFDSITDTILINEKFEIIFVANFPKDYDRRVIERLLKIADQGPVSGKYVFFHHNTDEEMPRDIDLTKVFNAVRISVESNGFIWTFKDRAKSIPLHWAPDEKPADELTDLIIKKIKDSIPKENPIDWNAIKPAEAWKGNSTEYVEANTGISGNKTPLNIWFGRKHNEGSLQCVHGILAGMPGSGKSNFYHALVLGLSTRYSPRELSLYLIDGKDGVEFQDYKKLPHAEFISLKSLPSLSRSILKDMTEEVERRNEMFKEEYSVDNYENFRKKAGSKHALPRILLIVDEYQELFESDNLGEASEYLRKISEEGRSAGIHMLLGSQRFGTVNMMHQSAIFGNIHMRIAMKISLADRQSLTEFGREGKTLLGNCDVPGKVVVNDQSGDDGYNKLGKIALIKKENRLGAIDEINKLALRSDIPAELLRTNIFNGAEQPLLSDNPQFSYLRGVDRKPSKEDIEVFARKSIYSGGLGEAGWFAGESPLVYWLGQEFNVRGHAHIITRRRQRENVVIVGDNNDARYGMMAGILASAVFNTQNNALEFIVVDKSIPGTPWSNILSQISQQVIASGHHKMQFTSRKDEVFQMLLKLSTEIARRKELPEDERASLSTILLSVSDADRIDGLNLELNKYGAQEEPEYGKLLRQIIIEGPALGVHSFLSFEGVMQLYNIISKKNLEFFRHRVALQMSEQDAFELVRRREASRLQGHGARPIASFYLDIGSNKTSTFKPYTASKSIPGELIK